MKQSELKYHKINLVGLFEEYDNYLYVLYFGMRYRSQIRILYDNHISNYEMKILQKIYNKEIRHQL